MAPKYVCNETGGIHLTAPELAWVVDKNFYTLKSAADRITAVAIALAESSGYTGCVGDCAIGYSLGLWQIHVPAHPVIINAGGKWDNAYDNAGMAAEVYRGEGFKAWSTYKDGAYQSHMTEATAGWNAKTKPAAVEGGTFRTADGKVAPVPGPIGTVQTGVNAVTDTAQALGNIGVALGKGAVWVGNPHNWLRIALVVLGGGVVLAGLAKLVGYDAGLSPVGAIRKLPTMPAAAANAKTKPATASSAKEEVPANA